MISWMMLTALAAEPADADWLEVVSRATHPASSRWTVEEAAPAWEKACAEGHEAACAVRDGTPVAEALAASCAIDDGTIPDGADLVACLGVLWSTEVLEPEQAYQGYRSLCEDGIDEACADVARAHADGVGTYLSRRRARRIAEPLCADEVGAACVVLGRLDSIRRPVAAADLFDAAASFGAPGALWEKSSVIIDDAAIERLSMEACEVGQPRACVALAQRYSRTDAERARTFVTRSCALGSAEGCLKQALTDYELKAITRRELKVELDRLCTFHEDACLFAGFLGFGGDVRAFFPGRFPDTDLVLITGQVVPFAFECMRDFRDRHPKWTNEVELKLRMWVDEEGAVRGVLPETNADQTYRECVVEHALGVTTDEVPDGGAALIEDEMSLGMEANITVSSFKGASGSQQMQDLEKLAYEEWTAPMNACYMHNGGSAWDKVFMWVYGELMRDGSFVGTKLIEGSGDDPTDACVLDLLQGITLDETYTYNEKVRIFVRFNEVYRAPRERGRGYGEAADPDTYMFGPDNIPPDRDF